MEPTKQITSILGAFVKKDTLKINNLWYITYIMASGTIKKLFSVDCINIYLCSIFLSIDFEISK